MKHIHGFVRLLMTMCLFCCFALNAKAQSDLIITGVIDGPRTGGLPKAVELYVLNDIADLSIYGLESANNGAASAGVEFTFPNNALTAGTFIYVASEAPGFTAYFGIAPTYTNGVANINGDDAMVLFKNGSIVDVYGVIGQDGTGQVWDHEDGWAYRKNETGPDGATFASANWNFSGTNALDPLGISGVNPTSGSARFPIGTYQPAPIITQTLVSIQATDTDATELGQGTATFRISRTGATTNALTVSYTVGGTASNGTDYTPNLTGTAIIPADAAFVDIIITPEDDNDVEGNETVTLTLTDAADYDLGSPASATATITDNDQAVVITKIHTIQGNASTQLPNISGSGAHNDRSPLEGQTVTIEGIVTATYNDLNAFFMQEEDADVDGDPSTSEGIFVFLNADPTVSVGDKVQVIGAVDEFFGMTQIDNDNGNLLVTLVSSSNALPSTATIDLPIADNQDVDDFYEQFEGMRVNFQDKMVVSEYFELARYGQIVLTENSRPFQYSHIDNTPTVSEFAAFQDNLARRTIILDDENNIQNAPLTLPAPNNVFFHPQPNGLGTGTQGVNFFRGGDAVNNLTGILHWSFAGQSGTDAWRIRPTLTNPVQFTVENPRPATTASVGGNVKVASFNVLNYFTTIDNGSNDGRGADSQDELTRQTQKLVEALEGINADIFGLVEIENNNNTALLAVVDALNNEVGAGTYLPVLTGTVGTDAITVAFMYNKNVVAPVGAPAILDAASFTDPNSTGQQRSRPAVAVTFEVIDNSNPDFGAKFTVVANHLKSKGAAGASGADLDQNDGQGAWNDTRAKGATALANWLATDPTGSGDPDFLIIGDLNAYKGEAPITNLKNAGYTDLVESFGGSNAYSYVFDGQLGYLDHALANGALTSQVTSVTEWHINADEVPVFDYNNTVDDGAGEQSFEAKPTGNNLFESNAFRTSDHDPVIVGLNLTVPCTASIQSIDKSNPTNCGLNNGSITVNATGISLEYSINNGASFQNSNVFNNLGAGSYDVIVREENDNACVATQQVTLSAPSAPIISNVSAVCDGTTAKITVTASADGETLEYSIGGAFQASNVFNALPSNTFYTVTVRKANATACTATDNVTTPDCTPTCNAIAVTELRLVNSTNGSLIKVLQSGDVIDRLATPNYNIVAITENCNGQIVESVVFRRNGATFSTENVAPFAMGGDNNGNFYKLNLPLGTQTIRATPFTADGGKGIIGNFLEVNISVVEGTTPVCTNISVKELRLVNSSNGNLIKILQNGDVINVAANPNYNIVAITEDCSGKKVESVEFRRNGGIFRIENTAPYAMAGDNNGNFFNLNLPLGTQTIRATPFSADGAKGIIGNFLDVNVTLVNNAARVAQSNAPDAPLAIELSMYPNPTSEQIYVKVANPEFGQVTVQVTDLLGRVMAYKTVEKTQTVLETEMNVSTFPEGTYLLKVQHGDAQKIERFFVEKK
ncbi:MAG: ExeM/NucH family extracellular endonuclease [Microscillaceae bacterium]|nr:ExeM/NucH family extracellular endonuclease [Microscillaceae bacterium]